MSHFSRILWRGKWGFPQRLEVRLCILSVLCGESFSGLQQAWTLTPRSFHHFRISERVHLCVFSQFTVALK